MTVFLRAWSLIKWPLRPRLWLFGVEFGLQFLLAAALLLYSIHFYQLSVSFQASLDKMDRNHPGWRLQDRQNAREVIPDSENSALRVAEVDRLLPDPWIDKDLADEVQTLSAQTQLSLDQFARLQHTLDQVRPALDAGRTLADLPKGRYAITYLTDRSNPVAKVYGMPTRRVILLLRADAVVALQAGDKAVALHSSLAGLNVARSIGDEPGNLAQLVRIAIVTIALKNVDRLLAQSELDEKQLATLQTALVAEERFPYWPTVLYGERALQDLPLEAMAKGDLIPLDPEPGEYSSQAGHTPNGWMDQTAAYYFFRDRVPYWGPRLFEFYDRLEGTAQMPAHLRQPVLDQVAKDVYHGTNPLLLGFPAMAIVSKACSRIQAALRCEAAALAAERYRQLRGDWPPSLDALAPDFLAAVPSDPFTGDPLLYHRTPDGVVIYSVSSDGVDNGGAVDEPNPTLPGTDLGVRLWDVAKRRQPPMPPAPPVPPR